MECSKIKYDSREEAEQHLKEIILSNNKPWRTNKYKKPSHVYQCDNPSCNGVWHLTSKPRVKVY